MRQLKYLMILFTLISQTLISQEENILKVEGKAEIEVVPEVMKYTLKISISSETHKGSLDTLDLVITRLVNTLTSVGVSSDSILTESFNVEVREGRFNPNIETQYIANQQVILKSNSKSETILSIINAISDLDLPIQIINRAEISKKQSDNVQARLLKEAFNDAKEKALRIAQAGEFQIDGISRVDYGDRFDPFGDKMYTLAEEVEIGYQNQSRSFGNYNIPPKKFTKSIIVTYKIKIN
ncbi:SIMPL domain-containing protein [uncultured Roseivirga sp.]|mgnify:CR=1 FL=1|uniref:SIMPL domain-containing protein n=1 Tax=uncultured Roseivirga sp. TaxID=543088 RepID=UPI000D7A9B3A|nr:SIMPL domain-containing protein [uncultured Roseivirga sp.]PWL31678.1 MAG: hypothetical protein DCO95_00400 [Roseivirga sp. XM-24bin3]